MAARSLGLSLVAALVAAIGLVGAAAPSAHAATGGCSYDSGVVVVVDYNGLGGYQERKGCDPVGGHTAETSFNDAGFTLGELTTGGMSGYVCTVNGLPSDHDCTQSDAYWSLWWSDGKDGSWHYASSGVKSLKVPAGGYVGFSWDTQSGNNPPGVVPTERQAKPTPTQTPSPTHSATSTPTKHHHHAAAPATSPTTTATTAATTPTATSTASATSTAPARRHSRAPVETPAPLPSTTASLPTIDQISAGPPADASADPGTGPGTWIAIGLGVLVIGGAAAVPLLRRRRG